MTYYPYLLADTLLGLLACLAMRLAPGTEEIVAWLTGCSWAGLAALRLKYLGWTLWILLPCALTLGLAVWEVANAAKVAGFLGVAYTAALSIVLLAHRGHDRPASC